MKVKELMKMLLDMDPEAEVMISGHEDGYHKMNTLVECGMDAVDPKECEAWYYGEYQKHNALVYKPEIDKIGPNPVKAEFKAVIITHRKEALK